MDRVRRRRCIDVGVGLATRVTAKRGHALGGAAAQARVAHLESGRGTWSADHRLRLNLHALHRRSAHSGRARARAALSGTRSSTRSSAKGTLPSAAAASAASSSAVHSPKSESRAHTSASLPLKTRRASAP
jgi:hypothetical protein